MIKCSRTRVVKYRVVSPIWQALQPAHKKILSKRNGERSLQGMRSFQLVYNCVNPFIPAGKVNLYAKIPLCYRRENRNDASNVKMTSPPRVNSRPATSPKELSSPRRPTSRKELERGATQPEIIKSPPRSANAVSTRVYF